MKQLLLPLAICILHSSFFIPHSVIAQPLDSAYHDNDEIIAELRAYAENYPDWMRLDSIGYSAEDSLPIWCVKLSDNPGRIEPEAALLFVGQVHAEEVVGVELVLEIMKQMLDNNEDNRMRQRLEGLEIYIIPTANPEGLEVVHTGLDVTFRKNKRDNVGDGQLRIFDGEGWDTSGVDINRNFGTHWDRGDTLYRPEENLRYNAYRGSAPFSEPESRALRDLALSRPFLYSIVYHSSRTGNSTELFIAPWFWRENGIIKRPPDAEAINALGAQVAGMIPGMRNRDVPYRPVQSMQRKGQLQDWFYVETGCIQFMAEVAADIHPAEDTMRMVVNDNLPAVWYLMDLALGLEGLDGFGTLTVIARDAETGEPLEANIEVDGDTHPILAPRRTNENNGRYDWLLPTGNHRITVSRFGYNTREWNEVDIPDGERLVLEPSLSLSDLIEVSFTFVDSLHEGLQVLTRIQGLTDPAIFDQIEGIVSTYELPEGLYQALFTSVNIFPPRVVPTLFSFEPQVEPFQIPLVYGGLASREDFASLEHRWERSGDGWGIVSFEGRSCLTESVVGDYPTEANLWLELGGIFILNDTAQATMRIIHLPYCEPQDDYQQIEWWTNPDDVHSKRYSQLRRYRRPAAGDGAEVPDWDTLYISLDSLERGPLSVRFRTVSDDAIGEDGWLIDDVAVFIEGYDVSVANPPPAPRTLHLEPVYPNPFNSSTTITFSLSAQSASSAVNLAVYDLQGRLVADLLTGKMPILRAGEHKVVWDAGDTPNGLYLVRLEQSNSISTRKVVLIK
jgi:hypothetical protein